MRFRRFGLVMILLLAAWVAAAEQIGLVIAIEGKATAVSADGRQRTLTLQSPVFPKDSITTGVDAKLQLMFNDDSVIAQGEKSQLTIDEYIYNPKDEGKVKCAVRLAKGLFRAITGRIVELRPERFKAKTRIATIGIRGCEVGFKIDVEEETIYVLALPADHRVIIQTDHKEVMHVAIPGVVVLIREDEDLSRRPATSREIRAIIQGTTPGATSTADIDPASGRISGPPHPPPRPRSSLLGQGSGLIVPEPDANSTPSPSARIFSHRGGGTDWDWGTWALDGVVDAVSINNMAPITAAFDSIANGATLYNLSGNGTAAAVITHNGTHALVEGSVNLNVQVGASVAPNWDGTFGMNNGSGDSLNFGAAGNIQSSGEFSGSPYWYSMQVQGQPFNAASITSANMDGNLAGPGSGGNPITGATGTFTVEHGPNTSVDGIFGTDVQ